MSKYDPLGEYLKGQPASTSSLTLSFQQIEEILGLDLPRTARNRPQWWANETSPYSRHSQRVWLDARCETRNLDLRSRSVTFVRTGPTNRGRRPSNPAPVPVGSPTLPTTGESRRRIGLISCTKAKLNRPAPARELYSASPLFRKAAAYCDAYLDGWFVLSAKYGLVEPQRRIEPYDVTLKTMPRSECRRWGKQVAHEIRELGDVVLEAHAGTNYVRPLLEAGVVLDEPLRGLAIGNRMHWYDERLAPDRGSGRES